MKKSFSQQSLPMVVGSVKHKNANDVIAEILKAEADGAKAFTVTIQLLQAAYHTFESYKSIAGATDYPVMGINYRTNGGPDDEQRIEMLREAVRAGFRSVDIPAYSYDYDTQSSLSLCTLPFASAYPKEISMRPQVIAKQKELIKEFKEMGAEVLMSAHVGVELSLEQAVSLALEMQSRGADIVKIITDCKSEEKQLEILQTNLALKKLLSVPFVYTCSGKYSHFIRYNAPLFGTMLVFANQAYGELSVKEMPLIHEVAAYLSQYSGKNDRGA
ncbi:MAG: type I 3-dehydroquinate dehydratase [Eubacteriales bacterium]